MLNVCLSLMVGGHTKNIKLKYNVNDIVTCTVNKSTL